MCIRDSPTGIGLIRETIGIDIDFLDWMKIGLPFTCLLYTSRCV